MVHEQWRHYFQLSQRQSPYTWADAANVFAYSYASSLSLNGGMDGLQGVLAGLRRPCKSVPARSTVASRLIRMGNLPLDWLGRDLSDEVDEAPRRYIDLISAKEAEYNDEAVSLLNKVIEELGWQKQDIFATIDGHHRAFYGVGSNLVSIPEEKKGIGTSNLAMSSIGMRGKKTKIGDEIHEVKQPLDDGTARKHEWLHLCIHNFHTNESFPIGIVYRVGSAKQQVRRLSQILEKLVVPPRCVLFDKEFGNSHDALAELRAYANPRDVFLIGPFRINRSEKKARHAWQYKQTREIRESKTTLHFACLELDLPEDGHGPHYAAHIYTEPRESLRRLDVMDERRLVTPKGAKNKLAAFSVYSNLPVSDAEALWFASIYDRRWAVESYFQRLKNYAGMSQSQEFLNRTRSYLMSNSLLLIYGAWRAYWTTEKQCAILRGESLMGVPKLTHLDFMHRIQGQILDTILD